MRQDVWLEWEPFVEEHRAVYSTAAARIVAINWGSGVLAAGLIASVALGLRSEIQKRMLPANMRAVLITSMVVATMVFFSLPKIEVRLTLLPQMKAEGTLMDLCTYLSDTNTASLNWLRAESARLLSDPTNDLAWAQSTHKSSSHGWENALLDGRIHEEDSPGNFILRESSNRVHFVAFDAEGAEHVLQTWPLPQDP
jgi:hypothetical protein